MVNTPVSKTGCPLKAMTSVRIRAGQPNNLINRPLIQQLYQMDNKNFLVIDFLGGSNPSILRSINFLGLVKCRSVGILVYETVLKTVASRGLGVRVSSSAPNSFINFCKIKKLNYAALMFNG